MKTKKLPAILPLLALACGFVQAAPLDSSFTWQGRLTDGANPAQGAYDLRFALFETSSGGTAIAGPVTNSAVGVTNGLLTVTINFGAGVFTGEARWLEIAVRTNGGGAFVPLSPRQPLTAAPYALYAPNAGAAASAGSAATVAANGVGTTALQANAVTTDKIANGTLTSADLGPALASNTFWRLVGNAATTPGTHFLGTTDNQAFELKANGQRALRVEPNGNSSPNVIAGAWANTVAPGVIGATIAGGGSISLSGTNSPNTAAADYSTIGGGSGNMTSSNARHGTIGGGNNNRMYEHAMAAMIGGGAFNVIHSNAVHATIAGGGWNLIGSDAAYATIAGGIANGATAPGAFVGGGGCNGASFSGNTASGLASTVAGGYGNTASGPGAFVGGGGYDGINSSPNTASGGCAVIGGGFSNIVSAGFGAVSGGAFNTADGYAGAVGGGQKNRASSVFTTVAGGQENSATNWWATVAGGFRNIAGGEYSLAAGRCAKALHTGAFVWADSTDADFVSTASNQFLIRASGGLGLNSTYLAGDMDVRRLGSESATLHLGGSGANGSPKLVTFGDGQFVYVGENGQDDTLELHASRFHISGGYVGVGITNPAYPIEVSGGAYCNGSQWVSVSDRSLKENFAQVNAKEILGRLAALPISAWNYKSEPAAVRHLGPMAHDFRAAFGLGADEKAIGSVDADGVALAAIQGLNAKVEEGRQRTEQSMRALEAENAALKRELAELKALVKALTPANQRAR